MSFFVYVLQNPDGKLYIGQTDDLKRRSIQHNDPMHTLTRTTKRFRGPLQVIYSEMLSSRSATLARENVLKSTGKRLTLSIKSCPKNWPRTPLSSRSSLIRSRTWSSRCCVERK